MSFATAVGPAVENARDAPNAPADRQALTLIKPYQGMVAWPTVLLAASIVAAFALVTTLAVKGTHHLFRRVPFYLYPKAFRSLKPVLDKEHAHIYEFGHEPRPMLEERATR